LPRWACFPLNAPAFAGRTSVRRVFPSTASRPAYQATPSHIPARLSVLPTYPRRDLVCVALRPLPQRLGNVALCPHPAVPPRAAVREAVPLYPRGPWLRFGLCCPDPSSLTTTPSVSLAGTRRLHGPAAYTPRLRCAGAPRRPARPSLLSLLCFPHVPPTVRRWGRGADPLCSRPDTRLPRPITESPPTTPVSASNT
jgi:hypothetical protein